MSKRKNLTAKEDLTTEGAEVFTEDAGGDSLSVTFVKSSVPSVVKYPFT